MDSTKKKSIVAAVILILIATLTRFIPHYPNFTALGGIALFSTAFISRKYLAFLIPFVALFVSDLALNNLVYAKAFPEFYQGFTWFAQGSGWVYLGFGAMMIVGHYLFNKKSVSRFVGSALLAAILFFVITNFGAWMSPWSLLPKTFSGLIATYVAGIPFFWSTVAGNLFYGAILFGVYQWIRQKSYFAQKSVDPVQA